VRSRGPWAPFIRSSVFVCLGQSFGHLEFIDQGGQKRMPNDQTSDKARHCGNSVPLDRMRGAQKQSPEAGLPP